MNNKYIHHFKRFVLIILLIFNSHIHSKENIFKFKSKPLTIQEKVYDELIRNHILYPEIVMKQIKLESGNFTSDVYIHNNNFLGLYNSSKREYYKFKNIKECILFYKKNIQNKYKGGNYYEFLQNLPYAEDEDYINKLKDIV